MSLFSDSVQNAADDSDACSSWCFGGMFTVGLVGVLLAIIILVFITRIVKYFRSIDTFMVVSLFTMLACLSYVTMDWYRIYYLYVNHTHMRLYASLRWIIIMNDTIYYIAIICMYICLMMRAYILFKNETQYAMTKIQLISLISLIIFDIVGIVLFIFAITDALTVNTSPTYMFTLVTGATVIIVSDVSINCILLYWVLTKMFKIVRNLNTLQDAMKHEIVEDQKPTNIVHSGSMRLIEDQDKTETERNDMINLMTKLTLLTIIGILFAPLFTLTALYMDTIRAIDLHASSFWFNETSILCFIFRAFEALINCVTLYFTFIFNQPQYFRCCSLCHSCLRHHYVKIVEKRSGNGQSYENSRL